MGGPALKYYTETYYFIILASQLSRVRNIKSILWLSINVLEFDFLVKKGLQENSMLIS